MIAIETKSNTSDCAPAKSSHIALELYQASDGGYAGDGGYTGHGGPAEASDGIVDLNQTSDSDLATNEVEELAPLARLLENNRAAETCVGQNWHGSPDCFGSE